jgi:hypothetical protein
MNSRNKLKVIEEANQRLEQSYLKSKGLLNEETLDLKMTNDGIRNIFYGKYLPKEGKIVIRTRTLNTKGYYTKSLIIITSNKEEYEVKYIPDTDSESQTQILNPKSFKDLEEVLNKIKTNTDDAPKKNPY